VSDISPADCCLWADISVNAFVYATLPVKLARQVLEQLNRAGASKFAPDEPRTIQEEDARVENIYTEWLDTQSTLHEAAQDLMNNDQVVLSKSKPLTMGYVTHDACAGRGDDIEHIPRMSPIYVKTKLITVPKSYKQP